MKYEEACKRYSERCNGKPILSWEDQSQLQRGRWYIRDKWGTLLARVNAKDGKVLLAGEKG